MKLTIVVDMNKGFCEKGNMADPKIKEIVPEINELITFNHHLWGSENRTIQLMDFHNEFDIELSSFPAHCLIDTEEVDLIDEILNGFIDDYIAKNTTNGTYEILDYIHSRDPFFDPNDPSAEIIICGCCTDICIEQLAIGLKTYFNYRNRNVKITVISDAVATYDSSEHNAHLCHAGALNRMETSGVNILPIRKYMEEKVLEDKKSQEGE